MKDPKTNKNKRIWRSLIPRLHKLRKLFDKQEKAFRDIMILVPPSESPNKVLKKVSRKSASRKNPSKVKRKRSIVRKTGISPPKKRKKPVKSSRRKKYDKEFQTKEEVNEHNPLMLYYKSLYKEKPNSEISVLWLTKFGVFDGKERDDLIKKFQRIKTKK